MKTSADHDKEWLLARYPATEREQEAFADKVAHLCQIVDYDEYRARNKAYDLLIAGCIK